jgi:hypothetical protein
MIIVIAAQPWLTQANQKATRIRVARARARATAGRAGKAVKAAKAEAKAAVKGAERSSRETV